MADGPYTSKDIVIDLTSTGARIIRPASELTAIRKIVITGTSGVDSAIILRHVAATVTNDTVVYRLQATGAGQYQMSLDFHSPRTGWKGLFMDAMTNPWTAGSTMIIYTA